MTYDPANTFDYTSAFYEKMSGGTLICTSDKEHRIVYANQRLAEIFECESVEEFLEYVNGSVNGFFKETAEDVVMKEAFYQKSDRENFS